MRNPSLVLGSGGTALGSLAFNSISRRIDGSTENGPSTSFPVTIRDPSTPTHEASSF